MRYVYVHIGAQWVAIVALALWVAWARPAQLVSVDVVHLAQRYAVELARVASDTGLSDSQIEYRGRQWRARLDQMLADIAEANGVVIVPNAIGARDWTADIEAVLFAKGDTQ